MKSQSERLNERLDVQLQSGRVTSLADKLYTHTNSQEDKEINDLLEVAHYLRSTPSMQVDNAFAQRLERQVRAHAIQMQQKRATLPWWQLLLLHPLRQQFIIAVLSICLLLGTGAVTLAAQAATPSSPLYLIKTLIHDTQETLAPSQLDKAEQTQQSVRDQLNTLKTLAGPEHEKAYNHELTILEQRLHLASQIVNTIQDGSDRSHANKELTALKSEVNSTLRSLLPLLNLSEQLATTDELNRQGEEVIHLKEATISIATSPHSQATITITGENFQTGARLFINNQPQSPTGTLQNGIYTFVVDWDGKQNPAAVSLLNPDDTFAQTTLITFSTNDTSKQNGNNGSAGKNQDGNNSNIHGNGNGNSDNNSNNTHPNNGAGQGSDSTPSKPHN